MVLPSDPNQQAPDPLGSFGAPAGGGNVGSGNDTTGQGPTPSGNNNTANDAAAAAEAARRTGDYAQAQAISDAAAHSAALASGQAQQDSTSPGFGVPSQGPVLPNGLPSQDFNRRLGDPGTAPNAADGTNRTGALPEKNTADFYKGDYTPGKGVADADGYFDPRYMSESNIENNARRGDPAAYAKLEVMAAAGSGDAKRIMGDLGPKFLDGQIAADFVQPHNADINQQLTNGAFAGNRDARQNLADQRMTPQADVLTVQQSNPDAYQMMSTIADLGGRRVNFGPEGVSWVDTAGDARRVAIGEIAQRLPELQALADAHKKTQ